MYFVEILGINNGRVVFSGLFLLLPEVRSPKGRPIMTSGRNFNPSSQAALRHMLSDRILVQRSTVRWSRRLEDDVKKHQ